MLKGSGENAEYETHSIQRISTCSVSMHKSTVSIMKSIPVYHVHVCTFTINVSG